MKQKYPRTYHLPWSLGATSDDKILKDTSCFDDKIVIITEKLDGENCLSSDTILHTPNGDKTISDICHMNSGKVLGYNHETNRVEFCDILGTKIGNSCGDWYEIELENGLKIVATGEHFVYLEELG